MDIYEASSGAFLPWSQVSPCFHSYRYFLKGSEVFPETQIDVLKILTDPANKFPLVIARKEQPSAEQSVESALSSHELLANFTPAQMEMITAHPSSLFHHRHWSFKYAMEREGAEVSKEREEELRGQLLAGEQAWKQASLEQLQSVSKCYAKVFQSVIEG